MAIRVRLAALLVLGILPLSAQPTPESVPNPNDVQTAAGQTLIGQG
jgi:hypothetical protein